MSHNYPQGHPYRILRPGVLARDKRRCRYCAKRGTTVDHIIPTSRGGNHHSDNMVCACRPCNRAKDNLTLAEWVATGKAPDGAKTVLAQRQSEGLPC